MDNLDEALQRTIDWLIQQGYVIKCEIDGKPGVKITEAGRKYYEERSNVVRGSR